MAQRFNVLNLKKNHQINRYFAKINFENTNYDYEIVSNANIRYNEWIDDFSILDGFDMAFNGELPYLRITGLSPEAMQKQKKLEDAFYEFIKTECSEANEKISLDDKVLK